MQASSLHSLTLIALILSSIAVAQASPPPRQPARDPYRCHEVTLTSVSEQSEFPDLPIFSGHHIFSYGLVNYQARGGPVYTMAYSSKEDAAAILSWYQETLKAQKWSLDTAACQSAYIAATNSGGNSVHVAISNSDRLDCRCNFTIQYKLRRSQP